MQSDEPLDYAVFQLSPRRSRCELFVSYDGTMEKLASGLVKPFVTHLKVAEEQVAVGGKSIRLDVELYKDAETWFKKGTLERFVRFVSTPEVLEMVNTYDAEMSQLEAARKIYSQGSSDHESGTSGGVGDGATIASDATKKELLRAIDTRLSAVKQDLTTACSRASTAGFNPKTVSELQLFADHFGSQRLSEACSKFINLTQQRSDLFNYNTTSKWASSSDSVLRASIGSDMSLDDPSDDQPGPARCTTTKLTLPPRRFSREPSPAPTDDLDETKNIKDKDFDKDKAMGSTTTESTTTSSGKPQLTRRLSVQERISLFENKAQSSPSTATTPTSTGGKPEFRRLTSDVNSSTDKAVLRRWSGASDMSIDVSGERKEHDSNANTPTPSSVSSSFPVLSLKSKDPSDPKSEEGIKDCKLPVNAGVKESVLPESNSKSPSFAGRSSEKDQSSGGGVRTWAVEAGSPIQSTTEENLDAFSTERGQSRGEIADNSGKFVDSQGVANYDVLRDQENSRSRFSEFQRRTIEGDQDSETLEAHVQPAPAQSKWQSLEEVGKPGVKDFESSQNQSESHSMQVENFGLLGGKSQGYGSGFDQVTRRGARKESALAGKSMIKSMEAFSPKSSVSIDQVPRVRQPKGNQGVNDELKMKANELEKLFAEHKLRAPGDQPNSARRIRPADMAKEVSEPVNRKQETGTMPEVKSDKGSNEMDKLSSTPLSKPCVNHDYDVTPKHNVYDLSFSDDSRGKLYQKYMQKRNAKLKEDWGSNRPEKEAQMKAMHDSLEKSRADMKVKLAGSTERSNSAITRQRAEKMRALNLRSAMKRAQATDPAMSDEDEIQAEFLGKKLTETYLGDSSSKSQPSKRVQPNKSTSSPTTRNPAGTATRSSGKASNSNSTTGRRRLPYDNPLTQSVPNFSDLRKENTRPSPGGSKVVRPQGRTHARKKSIIEDSLINEDKPRRLQLKKTTVTTRELNDSRNSDDVDDAQFMASNYLREENDCEKISNDLESTTLLRKGNGIEQIPSSGMGISKALVTEEAARNGHSFDDTSGTEEMMIAANNEEHDHETTLERKSIYVDNSRERLSDESDNNALKFVSQTGSVLAAESPTPMHSLFRSMGSTLDSPGESPGSWNSRLQNPYAFSHDISDIDALDSPTGSPASWNFHTLSQSEAETARMRKKWGAAQKPIGGIDSSNSPSRKDVTKSLKRFLKFGRRNRASENLADWISATTSEGDDSEDGRDLANRSSEDLGKSRMGFSQSHNSDEGFNGPDLFNEQVQALRSSIPTPPSNFKLREEHLSGSSLKAPKSFFSLSNFRSKANDSKLR